MILYCPKLRKINVWYNYDRLILWQSLENPSVSWEHVKKNSDVNIKTNCGYLILCAMQLNNSNVSKILNRNDNFFDKELEIMRIEKKTII